uniref:RdRp n=1 Tax=Plasmopara viticola lesion associated dicistro-like virus 1 TaxID=2692084 RepID=A0A6B9Q452_9VIRU|nr:RdRp [Plasmopara viticola lesion associated dicistro-like virus 1]
MVSQSKQQPTPSEERYAEYLKKVANARKYKRAVLQMFASAKKTSQNIEQMTTEMAGAVPNITAAADKISVAATESVEVLRNVGDVARQASTVLTQIETAFSPVKILWGKTDLVPTMLKIARIFANLAMARRSCMIASLLLNVCVEFGTEVVTMIKNWLFSPEDVQLHPRYKYVAKTAKLQGMQLDDLTIFAQVQSWLADHSTITVSALAVTIFGILQCSLGLPTLKDPQAMLKFFGERSRHLKSIVDFAKSSWNIFTDVAEWMIGQVFPGMLKNGLDDYLIGYSEWSKEVLSLVNPENPVCERVKTEKRLVYSISRLYKKGMEYSANLNALKIKDDLRDHFQKTFALCTSFLKEADHSGALGNRPRVKPYMIHLFGESGVGKSGMLWALCSDLNAALCDDIHQAKDIATETYFRSAEQEFWDGYAGQNICVWDDFGQLADTSANPNPEYFEIIRAGNAAPYPLHMATLNEKARTKFISKFCILTSNKIHQKVSSITYPSAYRRRIDLLCKVDIKPEFAVEGFDAETQQVVKRLDTSKCASGMDTSVYTFVVYNAETLEPMYDAEIKGEENTKKLDYEQLVSYVLDHAAANFGASLNFNESIAERMDKERFQRMRERLRKNPFTETAPLVKRKEAVEQVLNPFHANPDCEVHEDLYEEGTFNIFEPEARQVAELSVETIEDHFSKSDSSQIADQLKERPLSLPMLKSWRAKAKEFLSLRKILVSIGLLLGGLGIFGLFKYLKSDDGEKTIEFPVPEGFTSGDAKTGRVKRLVAEASVSGDSKTAHLKRAHVEAIDIKKSKHLSRALRHEIVTEDGWVPVEVVLDHLKAKGYNRETLNLVVQEDPKSRFELDVVKDRVRATQGHSYEIDPTKMYTRSKCTEATHFTYTSRVDSIRKEGIKRINRSFVHLHPGFITKPPVELPNRNVAIHVDLKDLEVWETSNGYLLCEFIPSERIRSVKRMGVVQEASVSGDSRTKHLPKAVCEGENDAELQAWKDRGAQDLISHRVLGNLYRISVDGVGVLNGLFVRDTCMLTVEHLKPYLTNKTSMTIENMFGASFTIPISDLQMVPIKDTEGNSKDAMLIKFPRHVNCHTDLVKHFQKNPELSIRRADICLPTITEVNGTRIFKILGNADCSIQHAHLALDNGKTKDIRDSLNYNLNTNFGDCGSPVIVNDNSFLRKIAGIHVAAYTDGSAAIGQSVTQADLVRHMVDLNTITTDHDNLPNVAFKSAELQLGTAYSTPDFVEMFQMPAETFGFIGTCSRLSMPPCNTDIRPSKIHGYIEPITKPAYLRHRDVNMIHRNMEKCAINTPYIPQCEIDRAVNEVKSLLLSGASRQRLARILTFEEAVSGSDISPYIEGIKRQSSPGYPHTFNKKSGFPGKTTWFGMDEWKYPEEIRELVNERIELAKRGIRYPTVWSDTLKDERRPIEKVDALKTRVFAHGPMDYTLAFRMYYLGFIAHIMENRITNEQSVGTNPFGADWLATIKKLGKFGKRVFAGDFSTFDGTLNSGIMKEFAAVANEFYDDGPENAKVREVLLVEVFNSIHLCSGKFIQLTHSQPSGNPLTTVLNSFYNSVSMRIAYYRCFGDEKAQMRAPRFVENVSMVSYGDDNVVNFSGAVAERFNQNTVTRAYATFGMIYTDEAKSSGEVADWRTITEVNYLKRGFRYEDGVWRAPLSLEVILECCNWVRKCPDELEACIQNCETAFRELAHHPVEVFDKYVKTITNALYEKTNRYPLVKTRVEYLCDESPSF